MRLHHPLYYEPAGLDIRFRPSDCLETLLMRRVFITFLLALLLNAAGNSSLNAQNVSDQSNNPSGAAAPFKLFAGVSHQEVLPQAHDSLKPHVEKQIRVATSSVMPASRNAGPPIELLPPERPSKAAQEKVKPLAETVAASVARPSVLNVQKPITQAYEPAFGVARLTADRNAAPARPVQHYTVEWFMIPRWMAGAWLKDGDMTTKVTDLRTGMTSSQNEWTENRMEAVWGHQQDAQGNYWHVNILPAERDGNSAGKLVRFVTVAQKCESTNAKELMTRTHYVVSESNPWNNQPIDTFQQESLNHYALGGQNQMVNSSSNRVFTYQGVPVREGQLVSQFARIRDFSPLTSLNGVDLKASLTDYLQSHSLGHLVK